jgi:phosphoribosylanthranilate isomerase
MGSTDDPGVYARDYVSAQGFLFDSNDAGRLGGSGDTFDWSKIPTSFDYPLVLAGGINVSNVAEAIARVQPWAVDVSSGVEVSRGVKSTDLIDQFFHEVERGDKCEVRNESTV